MEPVQRVTWRGMRDSLPTAHPTNPSGLRVRKGKGVIEYAYADVLFEQGHVG